MRARQWRPHRADPDMIQFSTQRQALVSLHDVTPAHEAKVLRAIGHLRSLGVESLNLLVVPDFHYRAHLSHHAAFCDKLQAAMLPRDEVLLHGFWHLAHQQPVDAGRRLLAAALTAGEGEFHALRYAEALERMEDGLEVLERALGVRPAGFVAPAWLHNAEVVQAARDLGLGYCEDHLRIYDLARDRHMLAPALSLASRSLARRLGSLAAAELTARALQPMPVVRLAVHPNDYDHPRLVATIGRVARRWLPGHPAVSYREALS